jgi:uncharacterized protein YraI
MGITARLRLCFGVPLLVFSAAALADNAMTTESADLYAGPDDSYPVVAELDSNSPLQVMGCLDDWSWCDVVAADTRGWMYAPDITYGYEGGYVPLYTYAPSLGIAVVPFTLDVYWGRYYHSRPFYGQRTEWEHREIHHRRPSGPQPHAGPIPRPEHRDGPRVATAPDRRDVHPGSAEPRHDDRGAAAADRRAEAEHRAQAERHDNVPGRNMRPEPPRPAEAPRPAEPPRPEAHAMPPHPAEHALPPREPPHEQHSQGPGRAAPEAREPHEERPHDDHPH